MAKQPPTAAPKKPSTSPLSDLSIYNSPHYEYKSYSEDIFRCPEYKRLLIFPQLLQIVKIKRIAISEVLTETFEEVTKCFNDAIKLVNDKKEEFIQLARNPDYAIIGQAAVITAGALGFYAGRRMGTFKDSIVKGLLTSAFAMFATGSLCFPKETDVYVREICYQSATGLINIYNFCADDNYQLRQRWPCASELPEKPTSTAQTKCPEDTNCSLCR